MEQEEAKRRKLEIGLRVLWQWTNQRTAEPADLESLRQFAESGDESWMPADLARAVVARCVRSMTLRESAQIC